MRKIWIGLFVIVTASGLTTGCTSTAGTVKPELHNSPLVIAHRAGGGQWPQNSRTAVLHSIAKRYQGIEIDIVLTKDGHPVLSHDPWVHTSLCRRTSGEPTGEHILIRDLSLEELQSQFTCGGIPDKDFPQVTPQSESIMTLDEVLEALKGAPEMVLYLDVKIDGDITAGAGSYAVAISKCLETALLPNPLYIEGPSAESLRAFRSEIPINFVTVLSYPPFSATENPVLTAIIARWLTKLRWRNPLEKARAANAGAVAGPKQVITRTAAKQARDNGVAVVLFAPNTREDIDKFCTWPADMLITDYPELGPCP